ncbi:hypothetical protein PGT21_022785 [Puccinia graminis f. sp. tritici]|uniref:Uncharacterized protein n=1 Tax=Puccinia graminis f. sp. tritici TaxID=56615 RepID=A0A5B0M7A8_PUCGR|nr:hypothetical protein PGTUg99_015666 [Puccinia graminis f. sp. tritici]KAA1071918.1 hypothetical protein PGT21_022785 [Puccinia graminis f. sp. tritici]
MFSNRAGYVALDPLTLDRASKRSIERLNTRSSVITLDRASKRSIKRLNTRSSVITLD